MKLANSWLSATMWDVHNDAAAPAITPGKSVSEATHSCRTLSGGRPAVRSLPCRVPAITQWKVGVTDTVSLAAKALLYNQKCCVFYLINIDRECAQIQTLIGPSWMQAQHFTKTCKIKTNPKFRKCKLTAPVLVIKLFNSITFICTHFQFT